MWRNSFVSVKNDFSGTKQWQRPKRIIQQRIDCHSSAIACQKCKWSIWLQFFHFCASGTLESLQNGKLADEATLLKCKGEHDLNHPNVGIIFIAKMAYQFFQLNKTFCNQRFIEYSEANALYSYLRQLIGQIPVFSIYQVCIEIDRYTKYFRRYLNMFTSSRNY